MFFSDLYIIQRITSAATNLATTQRKEVYNCDFMIRFSPQKALNLLFCVGVIKQMKYPTVYSKFFFLILRKENNHPPVQIHRHPPYTHTHLMWLNSGFESLFTIILTPQLAHKAGRLAGQSVWLSQWDHYVPPTAARTNNLLNYRPEERPYSAYGPIGNAFTRLNILSLAVDCHTETQLLQIGKDKKHTLTKFQSLVGWLKKKKKKKSSH